MNYSQYTTEELKERLQIIKELKALDCGECQTTKSKPWYPDDRNWIEHSPENPVDRSRVDEILFRSEREERFYNAPNIKGDDFSEDAWDREFDWKCGKGDIVAVLMK